MLIPNVQNLSGARAAVEAEANATEPRAAPDTVCWTKPLMKCVYLVISTLGSPIAPTSGLGHRKEIRGGSI